MKNRVGSFRLSWRLFSYWLVIILLLIVKDFSYSFQPMKNDEIEEYRMKINHLIQQQQSDLALQYLRQIYEKYKTYALGDKPPSFYNLLGVALYETNNLKAAMNSFDQAVQFNASDLRAWLNLVALKSQFIGDYPEGIHMVEKLSGRKNIYFALRNFDWQDLENHLSRTTELVRTCVATRTEETCELLSTGLPYSLISPPLVKSYLEVTNELLGLTSTTNNNNFNKKRISVNPRKPGSKLIKIGFLLHRIDSGPVMNLAHLLFKYLQELNLGQSASSFQLELHAFFLGSHQIVYPYQGDIFSYFSDSISLVGMSIKRCVSLIQSKEIDVLIEMNGWNSNTGLLIMKERPAPIQISYLGDPITTGSDFIDYYIGDKVIASPDTVSSIFTEKFVYLPTCYLVNSYLDWQKFTFYQQVSLEGRLQPRPSMRREEFLELLSPSKSVRRDLDEIDLLITTQILEKLQKKMKMKRKKSLQPPADQMLLGVYHNWNKMHPDLFHVWMNILHRANHCKLIFTKGSNVSNLYKELAVYGVPSRQIGLLPMTDDTYEHYYHKTAIDLYLDTTYKNGHVTSLDTHVAAVPMVTLSFATSTFVSARSTESILYHSVPVNHSRNGEKNFFSSFGVVYSLKEYEAHVISLVRALRKEREIENDVKEKKRTLLLKYWKALLVQSRDKNKVFQTGYFAKEFAYSLQAMMELQSMKTTPDQTLINDSSVFHLFTDRG